jgi:P27 family predicted phage terminase small subunit
MSSVRTSTRAKALSGSLRPDRMHGQRAAALTRLPAAPKTLTPTAREAWTRFGRSAMKLNTLTQFDLGLLELLSRTWASTLELERQLDRDGLVLESDSGAKKAHPALQALDRARALAHRMLGDLGLSPPGRERISVLPRKSTEVNPFDAFLWRGGGQ